MTVRRLLVLLVLLLLPACGGLPLPQGVQSAADVRDTASEDGGTVIVPPGPQPGASAVELVDGYLYALSVSPENDHAIARQFLAPGVECCTGGAAILYDLATRRPSVDPRAADVVRVSFDSVGRILADGSYSPENRSVLDEYRVVRVGTELRLAAVPAGLRLIAGQLERSFTPYDVHYLGRAVTGGATPRLVPDRVFLPVTADPAQALVRALLDGPSARLSDAVQSAAPPRTTARVRSDAGVVTVDLSAEVRELAARERQRLSAQLVWTLGEAYTGVRLLVAGEPFEVEGADAVQDRTDWSEYDPAGPVAGPRRAPLLFLQDRRLRSLDDQLASSPVTDGRLPVDGAALAPGNGPLAVRTRGADGVDDVRTGPLAGPFGEPVLSRPGLTSMSYGSGDQGLWVLESGRRPTIWLVPSPESSDRSPRVVRYDQPAGAGPLTALRVSRDGARIALVFGGRLFVGLVEPDPAGLRIDAVERVSRELAGVVDVGWQSGTSLVALGSFETGEQSLVVSVAVDGSSLAVVQRPLSGAVAVEIAAAPRQPLVVAADLEDVRQLFRDNGTLFRPLQQPGRAPFYPG